MKKVKKQLLFDSPVKPTRTAYSSHVMDGTKRNKIVAPPVNTLPDILDTEKRQEAVKDISEEHVSVDGKKHIVEAQLEGAKEQVKAQQKNDEKLNQLLTQSTHVLYKLETVFPFDFFTDEICIGPNQIDVCIRTFFFTKRLLSIPIKNIADVFVQTSLMFASLKINDSSFIENSVTISYLRKDEAEKARNIIQGLVVASKEGVDVTKIQDGNLTQKVEEIGKQRGVMNKTSD